MNKSSVTNEDNPLTTWSVSAIDQNFVGSY